MPWFIHRRPKHLRAILWSVPPLAALLGFIILGFGVDAFVRAQLPPGLIPYFDAVRYFIPLSWLICTFAFSLATAWDLARSGNTGRRAIAFWTIFFTPTIMLGHIGIALLLVAFAAAITHNTIL